MKTANKYTDQEITSGAHYLISVVDWVRFTYGEQAANDWIESGFADTKYMTEYNASYEAFYEKVMNLRKDQKKALEEVMLTKVYTRIKTAEAYERLENRLNEIQGY